GSVDLVVLEDHHPAELVGRKGLGGRGNARPQGRGRHDRALGDSAPGAHYSEVLFAAASALGLSASAVESVFGFPGIQPPAPASVAPRIWSFTSRTPKIRLSNA